MPSGKKERRGAREEERAEKQDKWRRHVAS
jgi:hypothetical protein